MNTKTIEDIQRELRSISERASGLIMWSENCVTTYPTIAGKQLWSYFADLADRIEAAHKREVDSIHRAIVLIAGIEMKDSENPPMLWTALEDAYDALSDALGTDGETTADVAEAKAIGRHFVIEPVGNTMKMREALKKCTKRLDGITPYLPIELRKYVFADVQEANIALSAQPRNCDMFNAPDEALSVYCEEKGKTHPLPLWHDNEFWDFIQWLFAKVKGDINGND